MKEALYDRNGLIFWTEEEIQAREMMTDYFVAQMKLALKSQNAAFEFVRVEAPILTPNDRINPNYTDDDVFRIGDLTMRPETTMGTYAYIPVLLNKHDKPKFRLPLVVWQIGKSFRNEQDQPTKFMRLKEFYQLEFQIVYSHTTENDYSKKLIPAVRSMIEDMIGPCYVEESDRLPSYSEETTDVVCTFNDMEVCSISKRTDCPEGKVLEVAIGMDRCVYNFLNKGAIAIA
jgi:glycyl-tRNA synthetase